MFYLIFKTYPSLKFFYKKNPEQVDKMAVEGGNETLTNSQM
jgi:hypothetical protein